jgi:hypothetical protein
MLAFQIGGDDQEQVRVEILCDNGDGRLSAQVRIRVGGFRGSYRADFNSWAFSDFASQLERLYRTISGSAAFTSNEKQLELMLTCDIKGHIYVKGEAIDYVSKGNKLIFRLDIDQTYVPQVLSQLGSALESYPPRAV